MTLFAFLSQVFSSDHSGLNAVNMVNASRQSRGLSPCCPNTGSYTKAKSRLPLKLIELLAKKTAITSDNDWKLGRVMVVDGSGVSMPDTSANKKVFPLRKCNRHGFPSARLLVLFSLGTGSLIDLAFAAMKGKGTGELSLLKKVWNHLKPGDTLLGDCLFSSFGVLCQAQADGIHVVTEFRKSQSRQLNSRHAEQIIQLKKPPKPPLYVSEAEFALWPEFIKVRVIKLLCAPQGFRAKTKYILTTITDGKLIDAQEILDLYRKRWQAELNLRALKTTLGLDVLRGQSPEMVSKEIWVHMLAYNLIRGVMYAAGTKKQTPPILLSFKAAQQLIYLARNVTAVGGRMLNGVWTNLLDLIAAHPVGNRPNRYEPRVLKRRKKNFTLMSESRKSAKRRLHKKWK
jgi:hypothetical protein